MKVLIASASVAIAMAAVPNRTSLFTSTSGIPLNCLNFEGGLRLTVPGGPSSLQSQELLLDTGSSTLAFCDASISSSVKSLKTDYLSCNKYGSGNEGYWGFFYQGAVDLGNNLVLDESYYSVMQEEVSMPCGSGLQGIFGVAFKQLDQAAYHPSPLDWPAGSVGSCPQATTDFVGPLMQYLKQDTPEGRLGIYWSGQVGSSQGELYVGQVAVSNSHYTQGSALQASLGETGYYDITIEQFEWSGQTYSVSCGDVPCLMDTGTPVMLVPAELYDQMIYSHPGDVLSVTMASPSGSPMGLVFDAQFLVQNKYVAPHQQGEPYILGLPLWSTYYTVFNVDGRTVDFVQHSSAELMALKKGPIVEVDVEAPVKAPLQCKTASYAFCCEVGTPCDCTKGTTAPGQCKPESYGFCCSVGTPCDCSQPPAFMNILV